MISIPFQEEVQETYGNSKTR